jgi:hypothetical protein
MSAWFGVAFMTNADGKKQRPDRWQWLSILVFLPRLPR